MTYLELFNELAQKSSEHFKCGYNMKIKSCVSQLYKYTDDEDILALINKQKPIFKLHFEFETKSAPLKYISVIAIADSVERASQNAIELLMRRIKQSTDSRSGDYELLCNLPIFKDKCFFTPYGLYWGDWQTDKGFVCSSLKQSRGDRLSPEDREEWKNFKSQYG